MPTAAKNLYQCCQKQSQLSDEIMMFTSKCVSHSPGATNLNVYPEFFALTDKIKRLSRLRARERKFFEDIQLRLNVTAEASDLLAEAERKHEALQSGRLSIHIDFPTEHILFVRL